MDSHGSHAPTNLLTPLGSTLKRPAADDVRDIARSIAQQLPSSQVRFADALVARLIGWGASLPGRACGLWCVRDVHGVFIGCALLRPAADALIRHVTVALRPGLDPTQHELDIVRGLGAAFEPLAVADELLPCAVRPSLITARASLIELIALPWRGPAHACTAPLNARGRQRRAANEALMTPCRRRDD